MDDFVATHAVPASGLVAWAVPDGSTPSIATLEAGLEVQVIERRDAWARVTASNDWSGWVDGRELVALTPTAPPSPSSPTGPPPGPERPPAEVSTVGGAPVPNEPQALVATHRVSADGASFYSTLDATQPLAHLEPNISVQRLDRSKDRTLVRLDGGAEGWVDTAEITWLSPTSAELDDLADDLERATDAFGEILSDFEAGRIDAEAFRDRAIRIGLVVREHDVWLLDVRGGRWWRYDGFAPRPVASA